MKTDDIKLLYQYNDWANKRILAAAENLTQDQLRTPNELGWGSLRGALVHILDAEFGWRKFLNNEAGSRDLLRDEDFQDVAALRQRWELENESLWTFLNALTDEDLYRPVISQRGDTEYRWVLWQCLTHVVNHGTQHRAECAALLTGFGHSPGDVDFTLFLSSRHKHQDGDTDEVQRN
ncbi:MAG: DinB family protein [Chloroflexota bacterium]|nr:DinB family protein [Chloroflexota bacterium]